MDPERDVWARDVSPGDIQAFMPVVELIVVSGLETGASKSERLNEVSRNSLEHAFCGMRGKRDVRRDRLLTADSRRSLLRSQAETHARLPEELEKAFA
jgi:hypothetical protein